MRKHKTYFEQIPVRKVKDMMVGMSEKQEGAENSGGAPSFLYCGMCHKEVPIESAKTDGDGRAVHEECYVVSLTRESSVARTAARNL
jgi:hypothetical protein